MPKIVADWNIFQHRKTGQRICCNATEGLEGHRLRTDKPIGAQRDWVKQGSMVSKDDADFFISQRELGLPTDAIAFLQVEHTLRGTPPALSESVEKVLLEKAVQVRKETSRACFGQCHSLEGGPACALCYEHKRATWFMCANLRCMTDMGAIGPVPPIFA